MFVAAKAATTKAAMGGGEIFAEIGNAIASLWL